MTSTALAGLSSASAQTLPTGYSTAAGTVGFSRSSGTLTINQTSQNAIVNYNSFSIGQRNTVNIVQPNSRSTILNRVTGNTPSTIAGYLNANGQVYLVNPNGIAITKSGVVNVGGGFTASSLGITDREFRRRRKHFIRNGSSAAVTNAGTITIGRGGYAALIGGEVRNSGTIAVPMGKVGLGSGEAATLDVSGDGFLQVALPTARGGKGALVQNSGTISAEGGTVVLDAATARAAARNAVNISGNIDAHSIAGHNGSIIIGGGDGGRVKITGTLNVSGGRLYAGGTVTVSGRKIKIAGTILASGRRGGRVTVAASDGTLLTGRINVVGRKGRGGSVVVTGLKVALKGATIDASGATGGGMVKIGGDLHGGGTLAHAKVTTIDAKSVIVTDATGKGDGGSVVVWSDETTHFAGLISAEGGPRGGDGGQVEVSSHGVLDYTGSTLLTAPHGVTGTLLLDPYNVVISNGTDSGYAPATASATTTDTPSATSVISATTLQNQLAAANVTITTGATGTDAGNITVATALAWSAGTTLTLTAANNITVNAPITFGGTTGAGLTLTAGNALMIGAPITVNGAGAVSLAYDTGATANLSFGLTASGFSGKIIYNNANGSAATTTQGGTLAINGTTYTLLYSMSDVAGLGNGANALATNLASGSYTGAVIGSFSGTLEGLGNTISGLTISGTSNNAGLIGTLSGNVRDIGVVGGTISGGDKVGGLVGEIQGAGTITNAYATGAVSGSSNNVGALVGYQLNGTITNAYATGSVMGQSGVGGLVGYQLNGTITNAYATGAVSGSNDVGGLVGIQVGGAITNAYATGAVMGQSGVGGLVGYQLNGTITNAYATGEVMGQSGVGGLVGFQLGGTIANAYWDVQTTGQNSSAGGGTGVTTAGLASAPVLAALNGAGTVWGNAGNQTTPYLLANLGPVFLATDTALAPTAPTFYTPVLTQAGLQAINTNTSANYVLANNIDLSGTTYTSAVIGNFSGTLEGLGNTISNLTISGTSNTAGLIGTLYGSVRDIGVVGGTISGGDNVGGLVGFQTSGTITNAYATGAVMGQSEVGGLVGFEGGAGTITNAYATGSVMGGSDYVGGLVGLLNSGTITNAYATGAVSGSSRVGGLVGFQSGGTITSAYATGTVLGSSSVGGLVGFQSSGTITNAYATGSVSGSSDYVGGLVGTQVPGSTITNAYATGSVMGSNYVGGLVGVQSGGTITNAYATGAVMGGPDYVGGLVGFQAGMITNAYWDVQTTGLPTGSGGGTGLTTAQLQGTAPISGSVAGGNAVYFSTTTNLSSAFSGGTGGLYPYLKSFFPNGVQAISGIAYADGGYTPAASGTHGPQFVYVDVADTKSAVTTGANGYYYLLQPAGTLSASGTATLAYTLQGDVAGPVAGATLIAATGTTRHLDVWANTLIAPTITTTLSGAPTSVAGLLADGANTSLLAAAAGPDAVPLSTTQGVAALTQVGYIPTAAAGFTLDAGIAPLGLYVQTTSGPITITSPQTLGSTIAVSLYAAGALAFDAPVTAQGPVHVNLGAATDTTTVPGASLLELSFAQGASLSFTDVNGAAPTAPVTGQALSINGTPYTLLYTLANVTSTGPDNGTIDVAGIDANTAAGGDNGTYALAANLSGTSNSFTSALVGTDVLLRGFNGTFEGLGHTISNLTISDPSGQNVGLIGVNNGTVRDIGLPGGATISSVSDALTGPLVGYNSGTVANAYATGVVGASGSSTEAGGLVGTNAGTITNAYATGAVSGGANSSIGGLAGDNDGDTNSASITNAYATGAVSGGANSDIGGLVGLNTLNAGAVLIANAYATGAVSGGATSIVGGLVGRNAIGSGTVPPSVINAYFDMATTGNAPGVGQNCRGCTVSVTGLSTASLQGGGVAGLLGTGSAFSGGANGLYPYLTSFYPSGVQAVSGFAYTNAGTTAATSNTNGAVKVTIDAGGSLLAQSTTGANGYYYVALPAGTVANGTNLLVSTPTNSATGAVNAATVAASTYDSATPAQTGVNLYGGFLAEPTGATTLSGAPSLATYQATANALAGTDAKATAVIAGVTNPGYLATGAGFTIDQAYSGAGLLVSTTSGAPLTVSSAIAISNGGSLGLLSGGTLAINAPVQVNGAGGVALAYDASSSTNLSFGLTGSGFAGSLTYADVQGNAISSSAGGTLAIDGTPYTLEYSLGSLATDVAAAPNNGGAYAVAGVLDGTNAGAGYTSAVVSTLGGTLEGLGHTITGLTITGTSNNAGLIGTLNGNVRDIGLAGGTISGGSLVGGLVGSQSSGTITNAYAYATGSVSGSSNYVGGLVGFQSGGQITNAYATGSVLGSSNYVGGLVGYQDNGGRITNAYATGSVSGSSDYVGGLVGSQDGGRITNAYATGSVSGSSVYVGGLVGFQSGGQITNAYATGAVMGQSEVGGLVGFQSSGTITNAYATGSVSGSSDYVGGLVGIQVGGTIKNAYATGAVSGSSSVGGLVGYQGNVITNAYWDIQTTGQSTSLGGTGLTTAQLQGTAPISGSVAGGNAVYFSTTTNLSSAFSGGTGGLYPYLASFYPTTPQAISGIAYSDRGITPLASGAAGPNSVFVDIAGTQTSATTGANGYYYVLEPAGTLAAPGTTTLAYTTQDSTAAGVVTGASLSALAGTTQHLDIWGSTLIAPTTDTSLSGVIADGLTTGTALYNSNGNAALAGTAIGTNTTTGLGTLADAGYVATGASGFTVNAAIASGAASGGLYVQTTQGPITVTTAETLSGSTNLTLSSAGAVTIDETVHVGGAGSVNLAGTSQPGLTTTGLSFGNGASIDYGATDQGGTFALNGSSYTLLYAASDLQSVNTNLAGNYAVATNLDASGLIGLTTGVIAGGTQSFSSTPTPSFAGALDGLGHVIANLTINGGVNNNVGLIGTSAGTVSNLTLVGGAVSGHDDVGALVGDNSGVVQTSSANLTVSGNADPSLSSEVPSGNNGGLVGSNDGLIQSSHATGDVSGSSGGSTAVGGLVGGANANGSVQTSYATGAVSGARDVGGLIGYISGSTVETSYATGAVSGTDSYIGGLVGVAQNTLIQTSYATGAVSGGSYVGGLAGTIEGAARTATITNSYATGAVSGSSAVGGLVGIVNAYAGGTAVLSNVYAAGAVAGGADVGGLIGETQLQGGATSSVTDAYYDAATTGQAAGLQSDGSVGLGTAALQSTATTGVSLGAAFAGGAAGGENNVYPYLTYFDPQGVQAVSGLAYTDAGTTLLVSPASGASGNGLPTNQHPGLVSVAANGVTLGTATTGANGYYYIFVPAGTLAATTRTTAYTVADTGTNGSGAQNAATYVTASGATTVPGTNIYGGWQFDAAGSSFTTLSSLNAADAAAAGGLAPTGVAIANRDIVTGAPSFALNAITSLAGTFVLDATGNVTQSAAVTANTLLLEGGGSFALTGSTTIATLAASGGTIDVDTTGAVTVGTAGDATGTSDAGIDAAGSVTLISGGAQTLAAHGTITSGGAILLAGNGIFTNAAGANALTPGHAASFTIYSQDPTHPTTVLPADAFGGLTATNYYNDAYNFTTKTFASAVPTDNHFVYGYAATLTPLLSGSATKTYNTTNVASLTNLTIGATLLSGNDVATFSFTGANYDTANAGSNKTVMATGITLVANPNNYVLGSLSASAAVGTIGKATIRVAGATGIGKTYDTTTALTNGALGFTETGVLGHDQVFVTAGSDVYASANAGAEGINVSGLTLSGSAAANYQLSATSVIGSGTIGKATITVAGATGITKTYDTTTALPTGAVGFTNTNALGSDQITVTAGSAAYASASAGPEAINVAGLTLGGSSAGNYQLSATSVVGSGTIGKATITVAGATGITKTYDTTTALPTGALGFTNTNALGSDQITVTADSAAYASASAGPEAINVAGLTLGGTSAGNYQLSSTSVVGSGTILPASLIVTANSGVSVYGDTAANPGLSAIGLQGGQGVDVLTGLSNSFAITTQTPAGQYALAVSGSLNNPNYTIGGLRSGGFIVEPRPIVISATNETRLVGGDNPPLSYQIGGLGLVNGDFLTGGLATQATSASTIGTYPIVQGTLAASPNYAVTFQPGTLTIQPSLDLSAATLGSTVDQNLIVVFGHPTGGQPLVFTTIDVNASATDRLSRTLSDPRFDQIIVCDKHVCLVVTPPTKRTSQLESNVQ